MSGGPLVSVVVCTYARPAGLRHALVSVAGQSVDGEAVVVNDSSPDVTTVVAEFADVLPVRLITMSTHRGLGFSRRAGIVAARGTYVAFLDDDNL